MPKFSETSQSKLDTCDKRIQHVLYAAIGFIDFSVLCGHRGKIAQNEAFASGKSQLQWPDGEHNVEDENGEPDSHAVDIAPYPIDWDDIEGFCYLAGVIMVIAKLFDVPLIWGGHWKNFKDYGHFEIREIE